MLFAKRSCIPAEAELDFQSKQNGLNNHNKLRCGEVRGDVLRPPHGNKVQIRRSSSIVQPNHNGSNIFGTMEIYSRNG